MSKRQSGLDRASMPMTALRMDADPLQEATPLDVELGAAAGPVPATGGSVRPALQLERATPVRMVKTTVVLPSNQVAELNALILALKGDGLQVSKRQLFEDTLENYLLPELRKLLGRPLEYPKNGDVPALPAGRPKRQR